ncbi:uncharacterized protein NECHADRAFT_75851 [Fusarium vanettenii 77-13-4]|uniref:Heterokaryon incompatibility domain-containing protein n=1 Tax=Fusarium vanettenii (strain ATCC MYA-4622 / CBS 123669 / FGSC 9596 / NRRL 45880 / 77-13-4) TaxID=660122 RepID=C7Z5S4_FUSV7|nr:uncharacterized protein NECHADRAFT_75851 [Fusarium vanettenii 77-13-4]EEU40003.1 hypothetical protein NECHADRAFT_75851 [Fusarium vanettenii 77-13-4]
MNGQASPDCPICHSPLPDPTQAQRRRDSFGFSISELKQSHARGCGFCGILLESINRQIQDKIGLDSERYHLLPSKENQRRHVTLYSYESLPHHGLVFYLLDNAQNGSARGSLVSLPQIYGFPRGLETLPEVPPMAECSETWGFISRCIADYVSNHPECNKKPSDPMIVLPSRVLQLASNGTATTVRLVDLDSSTPVKYAALSYSWGYTPTRPPLTTTSKSIAQMRRGIDISQLPSTLRDASIVCSRLGIDMLWIDSLCIIQDDANDWNKESRKMGDIYQNAFFTIVSASSHSCHEGFLNSIRQDSVALARSGPGGACIKARKSVARGHHIRFSESYGEEFDPIDSRAWTLQERVLSTRAVVFTGAEVQWQCRTCKTCECGLGSDETISEPIREQLAGENPGWHTTRAWESFLIEYTKRNLTMEKDKLPALSAIARLLSTTINSEYFAGLWSNSLVKGMCWAVFDTDTYFPTTYIAPSFSWASVVGPVRYKTYSDGEKTRWLARPVSQHIVHRTDDAFGGVSKAYVDLEALLLPARLSNVKGGQSFELQIDCISNIRYLRAEVDGPIKRIAQKDGLNSTLRRFPTPPGGYQPGENAFIDTPIHLMPLCAEGFGPDKTAIWCLLLGSVSDNAGYERLGNATVDVRTAISDFGILEKEKEIVRIF